MKTLLIDGDMLVFRSCCACIEYSPFNKDTVIRSDIEEMKRNVRLRIEQVEQLAFDHFDEPINSIVTFSGSNNFRYTVFPDYKANRKGKPKPINYKEVVEWVKATYDFAEEECVEADDLMGMMQDEESVIVSGDKDLRQCAGYHINMINPENGIEFVSEEDGWYFTLEQAISGDSVDGIIGIPNWGAKKAKAWLTQHGYEWSSVVSAYESAMSPKSANGKKIESVNLGLTEEDALLNMRLVYILKSYDEYNPETGEVRLWVDE